MVQVVMLYSFFPRITDAYNNARDRVRYLETLSPHLESLSASPPPTPSTVIANVLPALGSAFRQMDGLSRVYARTGYLGVILTKVGQLTVELQWNISVYSFCKTASLV